MCERAQAAVPLDDDGARKFFEDNFRPVQISKLGETDGFLTGYYEPIIDGSRVPTAEFHAPLYRRPPNLVASGWRKLGDAFPSKGVKVGRRVGRRMIVPYYTRAEIEDGALDGWHLEICYLRSQLDVLFAQIQGSARIKLEDGSILRVNYDSYNGWPYTPIGRVLVDRGIMTKDEVSMQRIRQWMEANPRRGERRAAARTIPMCSSASPALSNEDEAVGAEGVPLVPAVRSPSIVRCTSTARRSSSTPICRSLIAKQRPNSSASLSRRTPARPSSDRRGPTSISALATKRRAWPAASRIRGGSSCCCRGRLDPVEAGRDMPLPRERPSRDRCCRTWLTSATDPTAEDPPLPEEKPATDPAPAAAAAARSRERRHKQ